MVGFSQLKRPSGILMAKRLSKGWRKTRPIMARVMALETMSTQRDSVKSLMARAKVETANRIIMRIER